ncbi:MAG: hypothetical protein ACYDEC_17525, partial [Bacteroidia bacterium]
MTHKVPNKKFILTADFHGLTLEEKLKKETDMAKAQADNPTLVPGLDPPVLSVDALIAAIMDPHTGLIHQRSVLEGQVHALTVDINKKETAIKDIIVSQWMPETQTALTATPALAATAEENAVLLLFGVKGVVTGHSGVVMARAAASHPLIKYIDVNIHLQQTLHTVNSLSGHNKLPDDAKDIEVYEQLGGTKPTSIIGMTHVGI